MQQHSGVNFMSAIQITQCPPHLGPTRFGRHQRGSAKTIWRRAALDDATMLATTCWMWQFFLGNTASLVWGFWLWEVKNRMGPHGQMPCTSRYYVAVRTASRAEHTGTKQAYTTPRKPKKRSRALGSCVEDRC